MLNQKNFFWIMIQESFQLTSKFELNVLNSIFSLSSISDLLFFKEILLNVKGKTF